MDSQGDEAGERPPKQVERIDLRSILDDMQKERIILPTRRFVEMVSEEEEAVDRLRARLTSDDTDGLGMESVAEASVYTEDQARRTPLLRSLVEAMLALCKLKLLDDVTTSGFVRSPSRSAPAKRKELRLLVSKCAHIYAQLLLIGSTSGRAPQRRGRRAKSAATFDSGAESSGPEDILGKRLSPSPPRPDRFSKPARPKARLDAAARSRSSERSLSAKPKKTPFFEAVYALVSRAVLQGMRVAMADQLAEQKGGGAQLAARVEEELSALFQSKEFGRGKNRGLGKGGGQLDGCGNGPETESAQMAAKAEADLNRLIKASSQLTARLNQDFSQLDLHLTRNAPEPSRLNDKEQADKNALGTAENKDMSANNDVAALSASVNELIASFRQGATPRRRRKDIDVPLHCAAKTRSVMMTSLLPSTYEQRSNLVAKQASARQRKQARDAVFGFNVDRLHFGELPELAPVEPAPQVQLQNSWALVRTRKIHEPSSPRGDAVPVSLPPVSAPYGG